jgi:hypothetical protein
MKLDDDDSDNNNIDDDDDDEDDDDDVLESVDASKTAKDVADNKQRGASSSQLMVQSSQHMVQAVSASLERASEQADAALKGTLVSVTKELLLVDVEVKGLRKLRAKTDVRFGRHLMCYNPPGDTLCGFRVLYFILQLLIDKRLLLEGRVGDELKALSTTGVRAYFLNARTLDERARVLKNTPQYKQGWCSTADMERFARLTRVSFWYAYNGYSNEQGLYRVSSFDSKQPPRFILPFAAVFENDHFQLADMSPIIQGILRDVGQTALSVARDLKGLRSPHGECKQQERETVDLSVDYSYEDDDAVNVLIHTLDDVRWLQLFNPVMKRLGWKWVRGDSEYDAVYQLDNTGLQDNEKEVTGNEGLRQYFLSEGKITKAPSYDGARKRKANSKYNNPA